MLSRILYALIIAAGIATSRYFRKGFEDIHWPSIGIYVLIIFCFLAFLPQRILKMDTPKHELRALRSILVLAFLHLAAIISTLTYSVNRSIMIENEEITPTALDEHLYDILQVLGFPALQFLEESTAISIQWLSISLVSIVWGIVIYTVFSIFFPNKSSD